MSRIPDDFIETLLSRTDIVSVIGEHVELKRAGKEYKGLSPFTNEKSPSFFVNPEKQRFFDFSSGKNGTAIAFLMEHLRLPFVQAVENLAQRLNLQVPREGGAAPAPSPHSGPLSALATAQRFFASQLPLNSAALEYARQRGLDDDTIQRYGIGFAPKSWDALSQHLIAEGQDHALEAGLLAERTQDSARGRGTYDRFRNRLMFPIRDVRGRTIGFGGRTLENDPAKYLNSPDSPHFHKGHNLFGLFEARQHARGPIDELLVVEGYMDVAMLSRHGIHNAVATLGTAMTREQVALAFRSTDRLVFCFDGDRAGRAAAWRALEQTLPELYDLHESRFMFLPNGHDPDSLVREVGGEAFQNLIDRATPASEFLLNTLTQQTDLQTLEGRARLPLLAKPYVAALRPGPLRAAIIGEIGERSKLQRSDLDAVFTPPRSASSVTNATHDANWPVRRALQLLLFNPDLSSEPARLHSLVALPQPGLDIFLEVHEYFRTNPELTTADLLDRLGGTAKGAALRKLFESPAPSDDQAVDREYHTWVDFLQRRALLHIEQVALEQEQSRLIAQLAEAEETFVERGMG